MTLSFTKCDFKWWNKTDWARTYNYCAEKHDKQK